MPGPPNRPPRKPVVVTAVEQLTPRTVRVTVQGELADWPEPGAAAHTKVFIPETPEGPVMRTYTVRGFDRELGEVQIDFALHHGRGPAAVWAADARPGTRIELGGRSRSSFTPDAPPTTYLFVGDESAVPAIATCLEVLPASAVATVIAEVDDAAEEQPLESAAEIAVRWLHRGAGPSRLRDAVADAVDGGAPTRIWVACEAGTMREIRRDLLDSGFPIGMLTTRGYWKRGDSNHPDHDTGDDVS